MTTSTSTQNQTVIELVRSIVGAPENTLTKYQVERFGNYHLNGSMGRTIAETRVFVPCPENGVRELTDIFTVSRSNYAHTKTVVKGSIRVANLPEDAIIYQDLYKSWVGMGTTKGVYVGPKVGMLCYDAEY